MTGQRGRIQSRAARKDAPTVKRGRVLVPRLIGQTARARDTKQPPAEAPPRGTVNRGGRERSGRAGRRGSRRGCTYREQLGRGVVSSSGRRHGPELSVDTVVDGRGRFRAHERRTPPRRPGPVRKPAWRPPLWKSGSRGCAGRPRTGLADRACHALLRRSAQMIVMPNSGRWPFGYLCGVWHIHPWFG